MRRSSGGDNTAYPLTDLMTSLMVIFVLLLLVFLNNQASQANISLAPALQADLKSSLDLPAKSVAVKRDSGDSYTVVIATHVAFEPGRYDLNAADAGFLRGSFSKISKVVCDAKYRDRVMELAVEGHADGTGYRGSTREGSLGLNLKLSQERSTTVVREAVLPAASDAPQTGDADFATGGESQTAPAAPGPEVLKVLDLFRQFRSVPRKQISFRLTEDEINAYLEYALRTSPRPGVDSIKLKIFKNNYISTLVRMDLDALAKTKSGSIWAPLHTLFNGKKQLWLDFRFSVADAKFTFTIEKANYEKTSVPIALVKEMIRLAAALQPEHYETDSPMPLPFHLRWIRSEDRALIGEN